MTEDINGMSQFGWQEYHRITESAPPHPLLIWAVGLVEDKVTALDLGAGSLRDTKFLLEHGFEFVEAVDSSDHIQVLGAGIHGLECKVSTFDNFDFQIGKYSLVNAHYSLPFNPPETFDTVFTRIKSSLSSDGVFVGQLFGKGDGRKYSPDMVFHDAGEVEALFSDMQVVHLEELEYDGWLANGAPHHWHQFDIIAKKIK